MRWYGAKWVSRPEWMEINVWTHRHSLALPYMYSKKVVNENSWKLNLIAERARTPARSRMYVLSIKIFIFVRGVGSDEVAPTSLIEFGGTCCTARGINWPLDSVATTGAGVVWVDGLFAVSIYRFKGFCVCLSFCRGSLVWECVCMCDGGKLKAINFAELGGLFCKQKLHRSVLHRGFTRNGSFTDELTEIGFSRKKITGLWKEEKKYAIRDRTQRAVKLVVSAALPIRPRPLVMACLPNAM